MLKWLKAAVAGALLSLAFHSSAGAVSLSTYDSSLTNGAAVSTRYNAPGSVTSTTTVVDPNGPTGPTNLWWYDPDTYGISRGSGTLVQAYSGTGHFTTTVNMTGLNSTQVNAYPFFFLGCFQTYCIPAPTQATTFPVQLSALSSMPVDYKYDLTTGTTGTFSGDITFDEWIGRLPMDRHPKEILVMTFINLPLGGIGPIVETFSVPTTLNGSTTTTLTFDVYLSGNTTYFILEQSPEQSYITSGEIAFDLLRFLEEGARLDGASNAYYVQGIEFGTEFGNSSSQDYTFDITHFNIDEETGAPTPTPSATPTPHGRP